MNSLHQFALAGWLATQRRFRENRMRMLCQQHRAPMSVLFYHRVADEDPNDWTITTAQFAQQIEYCRQQFDLVGLDEVQRRLRENYSPTPTVSITFDDGYADNCRFALPYLLRERIPCTYFVATAYIRESKSFAHDVFNGHELPVNSVEQLRAAAEGGIEIGLHSANHVDFNHIHTYAELDAEIIDAKAELEAMINREVRYFAVPFGLPQQMRPAVFATAKRAGLHGVCSAYGAYNMVGSDPFHIKRIHGDPEFIRLRNWLSFDGRKLKNEPQLLDEDIIDIREKTRRPHVELLEPQS